MSGLAGPSAQPLVSIVIPTRNAGPRFAETLRAISEQAVSYAHETIVIDSGSQDDTIALGRRHGARVLCIPSKRFGHGRTRNEGIQAARGDYVILLVQDAVPADAHWLSALVQALQGDPRAAGAYSRQLPWPDSDPFARHTAEYWHSHIGRRWVQEIAGPAALAALPWPERRDRCTFNNVSSIVRRSVWLEHPFPAISYGEDIAWARDVLEAGWRIIYEPASTVLHAHSRSATYDLHRAFVDARTVTTLFGASAERLSLTQAWALLRHYRQERGRSRRAMAASGRPAGLAAEVESYCEGEDWYRRHFDPPALCRLFGPQSPWPEADRRHLLDSLEVRECARLAKAQTAIGAEFHRRLHLPGPWQIHEQAWPGRSISARVSRALSGGRIAGRDLEFIFAALWNELGRDYVRQAVLDSLADRPAHPLTAVEREQRSYTCSIVQEAVRQGALTPQAYWSIRLRAGAAVVGRYLGSASLAARGPIEAHFWGNLCRHWAQGI